MNVFEIDEKNNIRMTRGDTVRIYIAVSDLLGNNFNLLPTDRLVFSAKRNYNDELFAIQKEIPVSTQILELSPTDTKTLEMGKTYYFDVQVIRRNGDVFTILAKKKLKIQEEVG